jgi:hypothetical protein
MNHYLSNVLGGNANSASVTGGVAQNQTQTGPNSTSFLTESASGGTNATSVEGGTGEAYIKETLHQAKALQALADKETDSNVKKLLEKLAEDAYWIGGSQATYEYHQNGNQTLATLSIAMFNKAGRDEESANKALISIRDNEQFLHQDLKALLTLPNASGEVKAQAKTITNQVLAQSQAHYKDSYTAIPLADIPTSGLRTPDVVDPSTGKTAIQLVIGEGDRLLETGQTDNTPAVKTSFEEGQNTTHYAQNF